MNFRTRWSRQGKLEVVVSLVSSFFEFYELLEALLFFLLGFWST